MALRQLLFFFQCYGDHRDLHSFPTRRSSDLASAGHLSAQGRRQAVGDAVPATRLQEGRSPAGHHVGVPARVRSEEHTSELQSLTNLVCRLLLEKKNSISVFVKILPEFAF